MDKAHFRSLSTHVNSGVKKNCQVFFTNRRLSELVKDEYISITIFRNRIKEAILSDRRQKTRFKSVHRSMFIGNGWCIGAKSNAINSVIRRSCGLPMMIQI